MSRDLEKLKLTLLETSNLDIARDTRLLVEDTVKKIREFEGFTRKSRANLGKEKSLNGAVNVSMKGAKTRADKLERSLCHSKSSKNKGCTSPGREILGGLKRWVEESPQYKKLEEGIKATVKQKVKSKGSVDKLTDKILGQDVFTKAGVCSRFYRHLDLRDYCSDLAKGRSSSVVRGPKAAPRRGLDTSLGSRKELSAGKGSQQKIAKPKQPRTRMNLFEMNNRREDTTSNPRSNISFVTQSTFLKGGARSRSRSTTTAARTHGSEQINVRKALQQFGDDRLVKGELLRAEIRDLDNEIVKMEECIADRLKGIYQTLKRRTGE